jgi:hypothetical protein
VFELVDLVVAWVLFPLVLLLLCAGCGLAADRATGGDLPRALVPAAGFAAIVVVGQFLYLTDATAELAAPVIVGLALAGIAVGRRRLGRPRPPQVAVAAVGVMCVYAAPIVLSGEPTIAGFIRLDDTATWLTLTDRLVEHGRDLDGLAPSSYEATLHFNLADGYPIGAFVPFGIAAALVPADVAWLIQPYIAFAAVLLSLGLWSLATPLIASPWLRAAAVFVAAQAALLFGYYLWGGVKEVIAAALVAAVAGLAARAVGRPRDAAAPALVGLVAAGLLGVLSAGGLVWLAVPLCGAAALLFREAGAATALNRALVTLGALALGALPLLLSGALLPPTSSPLTDSDARGNLVAALDPAQVAGIWPSGDFRLPPDGELIAYVLIAVAVGAAVSGVAWAASRREPAPVLYVAGALTAAAALVAVGSPWVGGKALATASPAIPFAAMLAVGWLATTGSRVVAAALATAIAGGVLWSNALGYGGVNLAPREQLTELERIGEEVAGEGPTLMTEYSPYGVRHFLRDSDPEGISELRRHTIPLLGGDTVEKGDSADTDAVDPAALGLYRTLVLRRSPAQSRPPSPYVLVWRGAYYEAWQRPDDASVLPERLGLGNRQNPYGFPECTRVRQLAAQGDLLAATGAPPLVFPLGRAGYPRAWATPSTRETPTPRTPGVLRAEVEVERPGEYEIWLGGSVRPEATLSVDGEEVGSVRHVLNNRGGYLSFGAVELERGDHAVAFEVGGADLHPGSAGSFGPIGPLVMSTTGAASTELVTIPAADAATLCGEPWDWIEVVE